MSKQSTNSCWPKRKKNLDNFRHTKIHAINSYLASSCVLLRYVLHFATLFSHINFDLFDFCQQTTIVAVADAAKNTSDTFLPYDWHYVKCETFEIRTIRMLNALISWRCQSHLYGNVTHKHISNDIMWHRLIYVIIRSNGFKSIFDIKNILFNFVRV